MQRCGRKKFAINAIVILRFIHGEGGCWLHTLSALTSKGCRVNACTQASATSQTCCVLAANMFLPAWLTSAAAAAASVALGFFLTSELWVCRKSIVNDRQKDENKNVLSEAEQRLRWQRSCNGYGGSGHATVTVAVVVLRHLMSTAACAVAAAAAPNPARVN